MRQLRNLELAAIVAACVLSVGACASDKPGRVPADPFVHSCEVYDVDGDGVVATHDHVALQDAFRSGELNPEGFSLYWAFDGCPVRASSSAANSATAAQ